MNSSIREMNAFVIDEPNKARLRSVRKPSPVGDEVLIKIIASGFCGTDIHIMRGEHPSNYPLIPGHEFSGVVEAVGDGVRQFKSGDLVVADPNIFCESCHYCKQNKQIHCENLQCLGITRDGAFAEYVTVPERCVFSAEGIDLVQGSMAEPLGCVIHAHNNTPIPIGGTVAVFGAGTIGLMHLMLSRRRGAAKTIMIDLNPAQLEKAKKLGADETYVSTPDIHRVLAEKYPRGFSTIIDATGVPSVLEKAIPLLAKTGTFVCFGVCPADSSIRINPFDFYDRDWKLIGNNSLIKTMPQALDMLRGGLDLSPLIGGVITLEQVPEWFADFSAGKTSGKIIVKFS